MKREDQVASLEPSKELKELGVEQDSIFWWVKHIKSGTNYLTWDLVFGKDENDFVNKYIPAYTVAELGEMLPNNDNDNGEYVTIKTGGGEWLAWEIQKGLYDNEGHYIIAKTDADARAKLLIYLIKEGIIEP